MSLSNEPESEDSLIPQIKMGDANALAQFIDQNRPALLRFLRTISSDRLLSVIELDDLLQEVSSAAIAGLSTAPLDQYEPLAWLQQVARRRVVDAHRFHFEAKRRDAGRQQSLNAAVSPSGGEGGVSLEGLLAASMTSPSAVVSRDIRMQRMMQAIENLGDDQRDAVRMRYVEGLPTKQIAEKLGKTDVAVRVLLSRSMRQLEKELADVKPTR